MNTLELFAGSRSFSKVAEKLGHNVYTTCTSFSVASIGRHWNKDHTPKTEKAELGVAIVKKTIEIIKDLQPKY